MRIDRIDRIVFDDEMRIQAFCAKGNLRPALTKLNINAWKSLRRTAMNPSFLRIIPSHKL
jgi:hypothetical protein